MTANPAYQDAWDVFLRFFYAMDTNDWTTFESLLDERMVFDQSPLEKITGTPMPRPEGIAECRKLLEGQLGNLDTQHIVTNARFKILEEGLLQIRCYSQSRHFKRGEGVQPDKQGFTSANDYTAEVKKQTDGAWKMKLLHISPMWTKGDYSVFGL
jgi:ketosteroid isomerase-like protein